MRQKSGPPNRKSLRFYLLLFHIILCFMNDRILRIALYLVDHERGRLNKKYKSHFFRHKELLKQPLHKISFAPFMRSKEDEEILFLLARFGPLIQSDFPSSLQKRWSHWKHLPLDAGFYRMLMQAHQMYIKYRQTKLKDFLDSADGKQWLARRSRIQEKAFFEFQMFYKREKRSALEHRSRVRRLMRKYPLLRHEDLRALGVKNAQAIYEGFPFLAQYRAAFLKKIHSELAPSSNTPIAH